MIDTRYETNTDYREGYDLGRDHGQWEVSKAAMILLVSRYLDASGLRAAVDLIRDLSKQESQESNV